MIARPEGFDRNDIWRQIAAPLPADAIQWRQDGRPIARDGRHVARFVGFIDAQFVRERLDEVVPGEWDLTLEPLANRVTFDGEDEKEPYAFKARLQILGVIRESVGQGKDYKQAETDAFKRAAVRFGVGAELYSLGQNWVQLDGDGKFAKPVEDPAVAYARRYGKPGGEAAARPSQTSSASAGATSTPSSAPAATTSTSSASQPTTTQNAGDEESCPKCGGRCFDNRAENDARAARGEKLRPDWKCRDRQCDGVVWREKKSAPARVQADGIDEIPF